MTATKSKTFLCKTNIDAENKITVSDEEGNEISIVYKLIRVEAPNTYFIVSAECNGEYDGICIAGDSRRAEQIFITIVRNGVTPCVLSETFCDMISQ